MLYSYSNNRKISSSLISEILGDEEIGLSLESNTQEVFNYLNILGIPYKNRTIEEVLDLLYDRTLYEYMENQTSYSNKTYEEFKETMIYNEIQILIYHLKKLMLWLYDEDFQKMPRTSLRLLEKSDINPEQDTIYIAYYEHYKLCMSLVEPDRLVAYFNSLVGLKHFSVRTKAIYHAFVEEIESRNFDYDALLFSKDCMLSFFIELGLTKINTIKLLYLEPY